MSNSSQEEILSSPDVGILDIQTKAPGPEGMLPLTDEMLRKSPSGDMFGMTQNAGMGWAPDDLNGPEFMILSTQGGVRAPDGSPIALGLHTGHWEVGLLVQAAAEEIKASGGVPFAAYCTDPCDGRTQGTTGMYDSLPYRNDAAQVFRRQVRSLPLCKGVVGVATCDKGLPAMMMALAGTHDLPCILVPGGVTLPTTTGEDTGKVQSIGARYSHGEISLEHAAKAGCATCGSAGGGCHFLGTAGTSQVVGEALGLTLPHGALAPSGQPIWTDIAIRSAKAIAMLAQRRIHVRDIVTDGAIRNAMLVHAACGGSTNLLLHLPAIAFSAGRARPTADQWREANRSVTRFVDVLPNGPKNHPTLQFFLAGGTPEVMLHLRAMGLLELDAMTVSGQTVGENLEWWEHSERRTKLRELLKERDGIDPDEVIIPPKEAARRGMASSICFPKGNLCPEGSVIKATSIDPAVIDDDNVYRKRGPARVFTTERTAIAAIKGQSDDPIKAGDVVVLAGRGPLGSGMEEIYQITAALKYLPFGREVAVLTDARFSGVSTGACIGHVGPEALAGGPIGKLLDGDLVEIVIDRNKLTGEVNLVGEGECEFSAEEGEAVLRQRESRPDLSPDKELPEDTRLWAAMQQAGGGTWGGCVFDVDEIVKRLKAER